VSRVTGPGTVTRGVEKRMPCTGPLEGKNTDDWQTLWVAETIFNLYEVRSDDQINALKNETSYSTGSQ
jgi:hypothetical protein